MMHAGGVAVTSRPRGPVEVFLPETYADAVPYALFAELRRTTPVCWIDEPAVGPWPAGSGYWAVFGHADVRQVLRTPEVFRPSSAPPRSGTPTPTRTWSSPGP